MLLRCCFPLFIYNRSANFYAVGITSCACVLCKPQTLHYVTEFQESVLSCRALGPLLFVVHYSRTCLEFYVKGSSVKA